MIENTNQAKALVKTDVSSSTLVNELDFSCRALNSFKQFNIKDLKELENISDFQLLSIGFGRKTIQEIRFFLPLRYYYW